MQGLEEPALYCLVRDPAAYDNLHNHLAPEATWIRQASCPPNFPFYLLAEGDVRSTVAGPSCGQAIAADGVYAVAMVAEFEEARKARGASFYKRLHWETEAIGIRSIV